MKTPVNLLKRLLNQIINEGDAVALAVEVAAATATTTTTIAPSSYFYFNFVDSSRLLCLLALLLSSGLPVINFRFSIYAENVTYGVEWRNQGESQKHREKNRLMELKGMTGSPKWKSSIRGTLLQPLKIGN
ncbi:hypothetical protein RUM44_009739 [Polyplax serrata]|uniref:Uncharacterized protein n=1 Tax=Polyplax serrata TaxID=468196 RepID=A0ABR1ATL2_POLSC